MNAILQTLVAGILQGGIYFLISLGLTLIFGVAKVLNVFHGQAVIIGSYITFWIFILYGIDPYVFLPAVVAICFIMGSGIYYVTIRPLTKSKTFEDQALLTTFGLMLLVENVIKEVWGADPRFVNITYSGISIPIGDLVLIPVTRLAAMMIVLICGIILYLILAKTNMGKAIRAIGQNITSVMLMGINVDTCYAITFGVATALAGIAGALLSVIIPFYPGFGFELLIKGFCIVILGGMGSPSGALIGSLGLGIIESFAAFFISSKVRDAIAYIAIITVLLIRSYARRK